MSDIPEFTDAMHMRAGMMMDLPLPDSMTPSDDHQGMLRHQESMVTEENLRGTIGPELASMVASATVGVGSRDATKEDRRGLGRTPSVAFRKGECDTLRKVLDEVDRTAAKRMREGFNEHNFTIGVLNLLFVAYMFGHYPQHFWLVYLVETSIYLPLRFGYMWRAKPLCEALYYLDLCWVLNFFGMTSLVVFSLQYLVGLSLPELVRKQVFLAAMGAACGPLTGACAILPFVAVLFHDVSTTAGLFIHLLPPFVAYTFRWHGDEIRQAWPNVFSLDYLDDVVFFPESGPFFLPGTGIGTIAGNAVALYSLWFVLYTIWIVTIGLDLPRSHRHKLLKDGKPAPARYDTVFHSTVRGGLCILIGKVCWGRPKKVSLQQMETNDFELRDFLVYMAAHATAAVGSIYVLAFPCWSNRLVHLGFLAALISICVYRGAKRYTYYSTSMYGRLIRKNFEDIMTEEAETPKTK